jgi:biotin carboxyl carrier protein
MLMVFTDFCENFSTMIKAKVNDKHDYTITDNDKQIEINGETIQPDIYRIDEKRLHLLLNNKSYNVELVGHDADTKTYTVKVNGQKHTVGVKDRFDILLDQMGMSGATNNKLNEIKAPMPGLVLKALVQAGDEFKKGDALLVLEAMKMENILKAPADGTVKEVIVNAGDKVEKNQVLIKC